ncbi:MAG: glutathione-regulated potassium-efflux system protein KefC [Propionivibrio sp.]|uniref:glutathione-regulated potassium-efflux system protein KefC n=1 Tax=Propionivibrio sp. TaxID=2212460 RepID=UPI0025FCCBB0|nr:glutathione-regulated potassium-efflux system protein KefC [Propionivibrio sp.]MBL0208325.1 glutathione-regulated potassium-efflux system protein KefC [Propionivibrio sp.]
MLTDALIYLAAAVICVPIAQRLKLGAVLGYLIAGAIIGPWGLTLVTDVESIMHFSEFGVVLMLFVIGLELEPKRLIEMRKSVFGGGTLQVGLTGIALSLAAGAAGLGWKPALVVGLTLALSSTAIAIATMNERNFLSTPTGQSSFAVLLFQDIAAIPLLAIVPLLGIAAAGGVSGAHEPGWVAVAKALAAITTVIVIGLYLTRPLLRLVARTHLREVFTAFSLFLVIGIAQIMSFVGLSMGLGAFLAGVLLASSEYRHALETDIEPFKGLLLGLFFISVGMAIDFGLLLSQPGLLAMLLLGLLGLKLTTLWLAARIIGVTSRQRWLFAILLSQGGEFGFVVFAAAHTAGVLSGEWTALLNMVVALSMATTPMLLMLHDWWIARVECAAGKNDEADKIDEIEARIIIAGFGRFGQIVGRLLFANGINAVVLDHDPDQIEQLRKFGFKVFYGDAARVDLLHAAGADQAALLVNAIDDIEDSLLLTDIVHENFPNLKIIARARNVTHYVELRSRGVDVIERETFEAALKAGRHVLETLGIDRFRARDMANIFRRHNVRGLEALIPVFQDEASRVSAVKAGRDELAALFARDREQFESEHSSKGWH